MTYDPIDTSASDDTADSSATIDEIDATVLQGLNLDTVDAGRPVRIEEENGDTVFAALDIPDSIVDDFEDNDKTAAGTNWSWTEEIGASVVSSPSLAGTYSGEVKGSTGDAGWIVERDTTAQITAVRMLAEKSNTTEQGGEWAIGKKTVSDLSGPRFNAEEESEYDFISRLSTAPDITGGSRDELYILGTGKIATINANTTYRFLWENIDYSADTYDVTVTRISDDTEIASETGVSFYDSINDMDFIGFTNAGGAGGTLAVYADEIYVG